jgi:ketosteroid isomerase-like protein
MSEENVEIVRRAYVALSRGEEDTLRDLAAPELVVDKDVKRRRCG